MATIVFASSIVMVLHPYFGYPISLWLIGFFRRRNAERCPILPTVTIVLTVYNEAKRIRQKIENMLCLEYPKDKLQIVIASDGSSDITNEIVKEYTSSMVELLEIPERNGKEAAQKVAVQHAKGEVLVFTDAATLLDTNALKEIVSNFADPSVGCVSSEDRLIGKDGNPAGEGMYVRYEMWLRRLESRVSSLVGLSGSFFAARKAVCEDFSGEMQSDFKTVLNSVKLKMRGVSDPKSIGYYEDIGDEKQEFERKVRTVLRGLTVFFRYPEFLNLFRYGLFAYQYLCHKLLRWLVPLFLLTGLVCNFILAPKSSLFLFLLVLQLCFYGLALLGWKKGASYLGILTRMPTYFVLVNVSILIAWGRFLRGDRVVMWVPSKR